MLPSDFLRVINVDFGHTQPIFTFPIGREEELDSEMKTIKLLKF